MSEIDSCIACRICQMGLTGGIDYSCVECCVRLLMRTPSSELKAAYLRSMAKFGTEGHADRIRARYVQVKKQKRQREEK